MNVSYYLLYWPYRITWSLLKLFRKENTIIFYCGNHSDYAVIKPILKYFPGAKVVVKKKKVQKELKEYGVVSSVYPSFPDVLVMPRHVARKFPEPRMKKIGLRHGAYHFKDFVSVDRYHVFDVYFVTSKQEAELAKKPSNQYDWNTWSDAGARNEKSKSWSLANPLSKRRENTLLAAKGLAPRVGVGDITDYSTLEEMLLPPLLPPPANDWWGGYGGGYGGGG